MYFLQILKTVPSKPRHWQAYFSWSLSTWLPDGHLPHTFPMVQVLTVYSRGWRDGSVLVLGTGETAVWLRALAVLPGGQGLIPSNHMVAHYCLKVQFWDIQCSPLASVGTAHMWYTNILADKALIHQSCWICAHPNDLTLGHFCKYCKIIICGAGGSSFKTWIVKMGVGAQVQDTNQRVKASQIWGLLF